MASEVLSLRAATAADLPAVDHLVSESYRRLLKADYPPSVMVTAVPLIARANPALLASGTYYLAVDATGRVLGAGGWSRSLRRPGSADIRHVATHPEHLRAGIGRRILDAIFAEAAHAGLARLDCLSTRTATGFYTAMGFRQIGEVTVALRPGIAFPAIRMARYI